MKSRMVKVFIILMVVGSMLSGCSLFDEINNSLDYVDTTTAYINDAAGFSDKIRTLVEQTPASSEAVDAIKDELNIMKEKIITFNAVDAPKLAEDIHGQIINYNETLLNEINGYITKINDHTDIKELKNSELFKTIEELTQLLDQLQQLGL
jgi:hypothetical protein